MAEPYPTTEVPSPALATPTSVYRYYDKSSILLYVGITSRGIARNLEHNASKGWWQFVERQEVDHCSTRAEALKREQSLIEAFRPPFNHQHNPHSEEMQAIYFAFASSRNRVTPGHLIQTLGKCIPFHYVGYSDGTACFITGFEMTGIVPLLERKKYGFRLGKDPDANKVSISKATDNTLWAKVYGRKVAELRNLAARVKIMKNPESFLIIGAEVS